MSAMANLIRVTIESFVYDRVPSVSFTGAGVALPLARPSVIEFDLPEDSSLTVGMGNGTVVFTVDGNESGTDVDGIFTVRGASPEGTGDMAEGWQNVDTRGWVKLYGSAVAGRAIGVNSKYGVLEFEYSDTQLRRKLIATAAFHPLV
jgi:hypothetical protein